jgi:DNA-binding transcriptional ArsR family regulator
MTDIAYIDFFRTLCNETRLGIILFLKKGSKNVSQIVKELKMEQSRVSHNLQCLEKNGFVEVKKEGKQRIYSLNKDTIEPILRDAKRHIEKYKNKEC